MKKSLIISHHPCLDGFAAATIVRRHLLDRSDEAGEVSWIPGVYNDTLPEVDKDTDVFIVDFSYPLDVMEKLCEKARSVFWIDHHRSAIEAFEKRGDRPVPDNLSVYLARANEASGALLAWETFHYDLPGTSEIVRAVDDRDRWVFALPNTKEICAYGYALPWDFDEFEKFVFASADEIKDIADRGRSIMMANTKTAQTIVTNLARFHTAPDGSLVASVNCPEMFISEVSDLILTSTETSAVLGWRLSARGMMECSLRSRKGGTDVSEWAKLYGGGGHAEAAGFSVPLDVARTEFAFLWS